MEKPGKVWKNLLEPQISSVRSCNRLGSRRDMRDDAVQIIVRSFLRKAIVSGSGHDRDVHSLTLSVQHLLCLFQASTREPLSVWHFLCLFQASTKEPLSVQPFLCLSQVSMRSHLFANCGNSLVWTLISASALRQWGAILQQVI